MPLLIIPISLIGYGLVFSIIIFFSSLFNNINPYEIYVDNHKNAPAGIKRNYFFGPGFSQFKMVVVETIENYNDFRRNLTAWKDDKKQYEWYIDIWIYIAYIVSIVCTQVIGLVFIIFLFLVFLIILILGMTVFFTFFSVLWLIDRTFLLIKSISNRCPYCKETSLIPVYECKTCGFRHSNLVPGPYGVINRKCTCGTKLSTTFLGGRFLYKAHCPYCDYPLYTSNARQYGIQIVGGIGMGKTTFLASFWHEYIRWTGHIPNLSICCIPKPDFDKLELCFQSGNSQHTNDTNATMYSIIHTENKKTPVQMTIYDIAGGTFEYASSEIQQRQFKYCEGFLFVFDPTATPEQLSGTTVNFINLMKEIDGNHTNKISHIPIAIIITKADIYNDEIGLLRLKASYEAYKKDSDSDYLNYQNSICRNFIIKRGYINTINLIESMFDNVSFFPVSARGHNYDNKKHIPWGVLEPVFWLMSSSSCPLQGLINDNM